MASRATARALGGLLAAGVAALLAACGPESACGASGPSTEANAPRISGLRLVDQLDEDPWTVVLSLDFTDRDGNLGDGMASFYLNHSDAPSTRQDMRDVFRMNATEANAREGTVSTPLRFGDTIDDGAKVDLGVQLEDAQHLRSNCFGVRLDFAVEELR